VNTPGSDAPAPASGPWIAMWYAPRPTMRRLLDAGRGGAPVLAALLGISQALDQAASRDLGARLGLPAILAGCAVGGAAAGLVTLFTAAWLLRWTGSWLGGTGRAPQVRAALGWGQVPAVCAMPLWIPVILAGGVEVFRAQPEIPDAAASLTILACGLAMAAAALWGIVTSVACLAEAHRFTFARALASVGLGLFVLAIPAGAVGMVYVAMSGR
jgi:hypothetical protein